MVYNSTNFLLLCVCLLASCSGGDKPPPGLDGAASNDLTVMQEKQDSFSAQRLFRGSDYSVLFRSAVDNNFDKDKVLTSEAKTHQKNFIAQSYLEFLIQSKIKITESEVSNYYTKTLKQYKRQEREAVILLFSIPHLSTATTLATDLKKNISKSSINGIGKHIKAHAPRGELISESALKDRFKPVFFSGKNKQLVLGPTKTRTGYSVITIIKTFEKGTTKDLIYVQDEIQQKLLQSKRFVIKKTLMDSLRSIYPAPTIN